MSINASQSADGKVVRIALAGTFDYSMQNDFRSAYRHVTAPGVTFRVNMQATEFMDSSALGMLLLIKEHAESGKGQVVIESPSGVIKRLLLNAKFDRLFAIEG